MSPLNKYSRSSPLFVPNPPNWLNRDWLTHPWHSTLDQTHPHRMTKNNPSTASIFCRLPLLDKLSPADCSPLVIILPRINTPEEELPFVHFLFRKLITAITCHPLIVCKSHSALEFSKNLTQQNLESLVKKRRVTEESKCSRQLLHLFFFFFWCTPETIFCLDCTFIRTTNQQASQSQQRRAREMHPYRISLQIELLRRT